MSEKKKSTQQEEDLMTQDLKRKRTNETEMEMGATAMDTDPTMELDRSAGVAQARKRARKGVKAAVPGESGSSQHLQQQQKQQQQHNQQQHNQQQHNQQQNNQQQNKKQQHNQQQHNQQQNNQQQNKKQQHNQQQKRRPEQASSNRRDPATFDMNEIRKSRKRNALRILDEVLPQMVLRLRDLIRRSEAAANMRRFVGTEPQGPALPGGPTTAVIRRKLVEQLEKLVSAALSLVREHSELLKKEKGGAYDEKMINSNYKRLQKLIGEAGILLETHMRLRSTNTQEQNAEQRRHLDHTRLLLGHPLFDVLETEEEEEEDEELAEMQGNDMTEDDPQAPIDDTAELIELVSTEMRTVVECYHDLKQWVNLYAPPLNLQSDYERDVRDTVRDIIEECVENGEVNLDYLDTFVERRLKIVRYVMMEPLSVDRLRTLDAFENARAVDWRNHANRLCIQCERLMDFVSKHLDVLDDQQADEEDVLAHIYD